MQTIFKVENANPYADDIQKVKTVQIRVLDMLYEDEISTLVFIYDLTKFTKFHERKQAHEHLLMANELVYEKI